MTIEELYLGSAWLVEPSLKIDQVSAKAFPQLIEKCQIKRHPKQGIKYTEYLSRHCAGGQVSITFKESKGGKYHNLLKVFSTYISPVNNHFKDKRSSVSENYCLYLGSKTMPLVRVTMQAKFNTPVHLSLISHTLNSKILHVHMAYNFRPLWACKKRE